jgi:asparagine synthase (glutamine-hydrolysing)
MLGPEDCQILDRLIEAFGEPFGDDSAIPTYFVSQLARTQVTVALSGDGGDELFAGYDRYLHDAAWAWIDRIPGPIRTVALGAPASLLPAGAYGVNRLRALAAGRDDRYSLHVAEELDADRGGLLRKDLRSWATPRHRLFRAEFEAAAALPYPARIQYVDTVSYLPDDILTKVDRMSMVHSLEARVPILDHRIVEFASRLPSAWRIQGRTGKWLLKRLAERYLPREVLHRPKRGFSVPIKAWMRQELQQMVGELLAPGAEVSRYLEMPNVARLVNEHRSARRDHSGTLWRLLVLERWLGRQRTGTSLCA